MKRNYLMFLEDILNHMNQIQEYIDGLEIEDFYNIRMLRDAVIRNLEVIGEASRHVPDEIKEQYADIPWRKMAGLRNLLIHEYFGIDDENIWETIKYNLPETKTEIENILQELRKKE